MLLAAIWPTCNSTLSTTLVVSHTLREQPPKLVIVPGLSCYPSMYMQEYLDCLLEHFGALQDSSKQRAVVNLDDEASEAVLKAASRVPCITYSLNNPQADVRVESLQLSLWQTTVRATYPSMLYQLQRCFTSLATPCQLVGRTISALVTASQRQMSSGWSEAWLLQLEAHHMSPDPCGADCCCWL